MSNPRGAIAVVDDDVRLLESLENLFESAGYKVRVFSSAAALLDSGLSDLDCLITDIGMPSMDGFQLRDAVEKVRPNLPVFLVTGRHEIADQQRVTGAKIAGLFYKPFDGQALLAAVEQALIGN